MEYQTKIHSRKISDLRRKEKSKENNHHMRDGEKNAIGREGIMCHTLVGRGKMFDTFEYKERAGVELRVKEDVEGGCGEVRKPEYPGIQSHSKDSDFILSVI